MEKVTYGMNYLENIIERRHISNESTLTVYRLCLKLEIRLLRYARKWKNSKNLMPPTCRMEIKKKN